MIAKIVKGQSSKGVVNYILNKAKRAELLDAEGVRTSSSAAIARSFIVQAGMNPRLSKPVCHVSLSFSPNDTPKLTDAVMVQIAHEYMGRMGFVDTQYIIGRHHDKEHPHVHIVFNRVSNSGKTISDQNDRIRSEKICKELTLHHGLHFAQGKDNVNEHRLREPDKTKYEIYNTLRTTVSHCSNWNDLRQTLRRQGIEVELIRNGSTDQIQGVKFSKNDYHFNGSKIDRQFSFSKIDWQMKQNDRQRNSEIQARNVGTQTQNIDMRQSAGGQMERAGAGVGATTIASAVGSVVEGAIGALGSIVDISPGNPAQNPDYDPEEIACRRKKKKKKQGPRL